MLPLTKLIIAKQKLLIRLFWLGITLLLTFFAISIKNPFFLPYWDFLGRKAGTTAALLFVLAITPGIIKRLELKGLFEDLRLILNTFRRQFGIAMYLTATMHSSWIFNIAQVQAHGFPPKPETTQQLIGTIALFLIMPLFLTSNDLSVKLLKSNWKKLHRLVYLIVWLIALHIALIDKIKTIGILIILAAILETYSWVHFKRSQIHASHVT